MALQNAATEHVSAFGAADRHDQLLRFAEGIAIPWADSVDRGYRDLYDQLAARYEKAVDFEGWIVTILA